MSGALPTSPAFADLKITSYQQTIVAKAISGRRQTRLIGGQYWKLYATYPPMTRAEFAPIYAFMMKQRGSFDTFTVKPPVLKDAAGATQGTPLVNGASQTGRSIVTDGWGTGAEITVLKAGDFIGFTNHTKIYMVTGDVTCDTSGNATIAIEPELQTSPSDNEALVVDNVAFTVYSESGIFETTTNTSNVFSFSLNLCEAF
jgi:hypothetical protein